MTQNRQLSIIIVAYYSADLLEQCVASVYREVNGGAFELIVVSNGFDDGEKNIFLQRFPAVVWIEMGYNAGFARANNAGMKAATGRLFLLLNPDTIAVDNSIAQCADRLESSNLSAAGVQILDAAKQPQISGSFFVKGGLNHLLPIPYWGDFIRWTAYRAKAKVPNVKEAVGTEKVDWISGAFLMTKRTAVEQAGAMDEDFFLYAEEVEWCSRLRNAGALAIFGDLHMVHLEGATINKSQQLEEKGYYNLYDKKGLQLMVSNHLRVRKQYGVAWFLLLLLNYTFGLLVFWVVGTLHRVLTGKNPAPLWKKAAGFTGNVVSLWRLTPIIIRNKPHFYKMF